MGNLPKNEPKTRSRGKYYSIQEAAKILGVSTKTLRRWESANKISAMRTKGGHRRYLLSDLDGIKNIKDTKPRKTYLKAVQPMISRSRTRKAVKEIISSEVTSTYNTNEQPLLLSDLYETPKLHPEQKKVLKTLSYSFLSFLLFFLVYKTSNSLYSPFSYTKEALQQSLAANTNLPIPALAKSVLASYTTNFPEETSQIASGQQPNKVLAATTSSPVFSVNILSSFKEVADFVKGLTSLDVSTGTLEATGAANFASTVNVTGATTLGSTLNVAGLTTLSSNLDVAGNITSPSTTFNLLNTGVTTLNLGGASTTTSISASSGTTTVNNNLSIKGTTTSTGKLTASGDLAVSGSTSLSGSLSVSGASSFSGDITKINGVTYSFPSSQGSASTVLTNNGSGTLTWAASSSSLTGSGTANSIPKFTAATTIGNSLLTDSGTSLSYNSAFTVSSAGALSGISAINLGSDATGDIYYRNSTGNLARLGIGTSGQTLTVSSGIPAWTGGSGTGSSGFWTRTSTTLSPFNTGDNIATTGNIGIGSTSAPSHQLDLNATATTGTIFNMAYGSLTTLTGTLTGSLFNLDSGNVTATNQNLTGIEVKLPTVTNTNAAGTETLAGFFVDFGTGSGLNQNGAGTTTYNALSANLPALTQTSGTLNVNGLYLTTPSSITTGGTASGVYINASGVGAGTLNGLNITNITGSTGTERALNIGSGWDSVLTVNGTSVINGSGVTQIAGGGTTFSTYTKGDILYSDAANSLAKLPIGTTNFVLTVSASGIPSWTTITGSSCTNCLINNPTSDQAIAPTGDTTGLQIKQTSTASPTHDIFSVTNSGATTKYLYVDSTGTVNIPNIGSSASDQLTITPGSNKYALELVGTNVTSASLQIIQAHNTSGTIFNTSYPSAVSLGGSLIGYNLDLATNLTVTNQAVTGQSITVPTFTNTTGADYIGLKLAPPAAGGINENGGTSTYTLADITLPALTQTSGSLTSTGVKITTPSSITTGGTAYGINISASGVGAGTLTGLNISGITGGAGTETGISVGSGWDYAATFNGKVGIGTTTPANTLQLVDSTTTTTDIISATSSAITSGNFIKLGEGGNQGFSGNGLLMDFDNLGGGGLAFTGNFIQLKNAGTQDFVINSSGQVGISSAAPTDALTVTSGAGRFDGTITNESTTTAGVYLGQTGGTRRVLFATGNSSQTWEVDNNGGTFRFFQPGTTYLQLSSTQAQFNNEQIYTTGTIQAGTSGIKQDANIAPTAAGTNYALQIIPTIGGTTLTSANVYGYYYKPTYNFTGTATTGKGLFIDSPTFTSGTLTNTYGIHIANQGTAATTTTYGLYVDSQTGSGTNYAAYFAGGNVNIQGLTASSGVYTDASKNLTSTAPTSGALGYWTRTGSTLSPATSTDNVNLTPNVSTGTTTGAGLYLATNSLTTGTNLEAESTSITTGRLLDLYTSGNTWTGNGVTNGLVNVASTSTGATASSSNILLNLSRSGANTNSSVISYGTLSSVTNTGTTSTDIAVSGSASGGTTNYGGNFSGSGGTTNYDLNLSAISTVGTTNAAINVGSITGSTSNYGVFFNNAPAQGSIAAATNTNIGITTTGTGSQVFTSGVTTGTTTSGAFAYTANSLTSGTGSYISSNSITSGRLFDLATSGNTWAGNGITDALVNFTSSSTAAAASATNVLLKVSRSGANANSTVTSYGTYTTVANTGTSSTNVGGFFNGTGASNNYDLYLGDVTTANSANYGILMGTISGATSNYGVFFNNAPAQGSIAAASNTNLSLVTTGTGTQVFSSGVTTGTTTSGAFAFTANSLTTGDGIYVSSSSITTGDLVQINAAGTTLTTGNLLNVQNNSSNVFTVSGTQITNALPTSFTAAGDVSIAYDIQFTNPTASFVKSAAPLTIAAGEVFNSSSLTLRSYNAGNILLDTGTSSTGIGKVGIGPSVTPVGLLTVDNTNETGGAVGKAVAMFNQVENQDIVTASAAGTTRFKIANNGTVSVTINDNNGFFVCKSATSTGLLTLGKCNGTAAQTDITEAVTAANTNPGDIVEIDPTSPDQSNLPLNQRTAYARKAVNSSQAIGVITTWGIQFDTTRVPGPNDRAMTTAGVMPIRVSNENGPIKKGDRITVSSVAGVGTKATKPGFTVAVALEDYNGQGEGKILGFLNLSYFDPLTEGNIADATQSADIATATNSGSIPSTTDSASFDTRLTNLENSFSTFKSVLNATDSGIVANVHELDTSKLNVFGDTTLGDTVINGKLNIGGLTFDNTNQSINAIGVLKIQDLSLGNVEFMNGLITFDTNGNATFQSVTANKYKVAGASAGTGTITAGQTSVTINSNQVTNNSLVFVTAQTATTKNLAVTTKTKGTSFKVEIPSPDLKDIQFNWWIVDKQ